VVFLSSVIGKGEHAIRRGLMYNSLTTLNTPSGLKEWTNQIEASVGAALLGGKRNEVVLWEPSRKNLS